MVGKKRDSLTACLRKAVSSLMVVYACGRGKSWQAAPGAWTECFTETLSFSTLSKFFDLILLKLLKHTASEAFEHCIIARLIELASWLRSGLGVLESWSFVV